jgi:hypothetical protein
MVAKAVQNIGDNRGEEGGKGQSDWFRILNRSGCFGSKNYNLICNKILSSTASSLLRGEGGGGVL